MAIASQQDLQVSSDRCETTRSGFQQGLQTNDRANGHPVADPYSLALQADLQLEVALRQCYLQLDPAHRLLCSAVT